MFFFTISHWLIEKNRGIYWSYHQVNIHSLRTGKSPCYSWLNHLVLWSISHSSTATPGPRRSPKWTAKAECFRRPNPIGPDINEMGIENPSENPWNSMVKPVSMMIWWIVIIAAPQQITHDFYDSIDFFWCWCAFLSIILIPLIQTIIFDV